MAYKNSDGKITIDENVAFSDIAKMDSAEQTLRDAADKLKTLISDMSGYQGEMVSAISEKASEMLNQTNRLIGNLEEAKSYTRKVVAHYKLVDQQCKAALEK